jgi:precorrin-2 dehydrogenase/sirohydrochlorin ferrochelatase
VRYYPVLLDVRDKRCIVVGGGSVGERKVETLLDCKAKVEIIAKTLSHGLTDMVEEGLVDYIGQQYSDLYLKDTFLVIGATDDPHLNSHIAEDARKRGVLCNIVDQPDLCSFVLPSVLRRGDLTIAFSTSGKSPAFAKKLRKEFEGVFGQEYEVFLEIMGRVREKLLSKRKDSSQNRRIFEQLVYSPVLDWIKKRETESIDSFLVDLLGEDYRLENLGIVMG